MEYFKNKAETFFREVRSIEIYNAEDVKYKDNFNGIFPNIANALYKFDIVPETYSRNIPTKTNSGNYYFDVDINFALLDLSKETIAKCYEYFNKKEFAIVLNSNTEKIMLGNDREKLKIEFIPNIKDDNSGTDESTIAISGETIVPPKSKKL